MQSLKSPPPEDLDNHWHSAVDKDDAYCKGRATWQEARDAWLAAIDAANKAGDSFTEMKKVAKSVFSFYDAHREKTPAVGLHSAFRKPWRTRR